MVIAQGALEDCKEVDALIGQVVDSVENNFQPSKMSKDVPTTKYEGACIDPQLNARLDWTNATTCVHIPICKTS
ncbi:MAG: hypothetical protein ACKPKO_01095, partial [Candidatus Fonsibacter sp.]